MVELSDCDIVFTMVAGPDDFIEVTIGEKGILSGGKTPDILVDCTTISEGHLEGKGLCKQCRGRDDRRPGKW